MRTHVYSSPIRRSRRLALVACALVAGPLLMLAGCGGEGGPTQPTSTSTPTSPSPTSSAAPLEARILTIGFENIAPQTSSQIQEATCPAGYLVAGGGFNSGHTTINIMRNAPVSTTKWQGQIYNSGNEAIEAELQVTCLKVSGLSGHVVTANLGPANANTSTSPATATCPSGYLVAGGGFSSDHQSYTIMKNVPTSATQWQGQVFNNTGSPLTAQLAVICLKADGLTSQIATQNFDAVSSNASTPVMELGCPSGYLAAGGGFSSDGAPFNIMQAEPVSFFQWNGELFNTSYGDLTAQLRIVCMTH